MADNMDMDPAADPPSAAEQGEALRQGRAALARSLGGNGGREQEDEEDKENRQYRTATAQAGESSWPDRLRDAWFKLHGFQGFVHFLIGNPDSFRTGVRQLLSMPAAAPTRCSSTAQ